MGIWYEIKKPLILLVLIFLGLFIYTHLAGPIPFSVNSIQTTKTNLFTATGTGKVTAAPNTAQISIGITQTSSTVSDAQEKLNTKSKQVTEAIKKLGVDEKNIKTVNYSVSPNYDFAPGQKIAGYAANQTIEIKTEKIELANNIIDTATANGANVIGGVNFTFDDATKNKLENQARSEAVSEAKNKAESLAKAAGIRLGKVIDIQEATSANQPVPMLDSFKTAVGNTGTNVTTGENTIEITVTISYETL